MKTIDFILKLFSVLAIVLAIKLADGFDPSTLELYTAFVLVVLSVASLLKNIDKHFKF